jgi:glycosyltransferase involved in cell wall biosynthesis
MNLPLSLNARFLTQPQTGVQRYSLELLNALDEILEPGLAVAYCQSGFNTKVSWKNIRLTEGGWFKGNLWEQIDLPRLSRGSMLFSPANVGPFFQRQQVVTIHDASVFSNPDSYNWTFRLKYQITYQRMASIANHIITTSEFSKTELQHWLKLMPDQISVIYEGREHFERIAADTSVMERLSLEVKPFFIMVGSNSPHKNLKVVLAANELLDKKRYEIIWVGGDFSRVFRSTNLEFAPNIKKVGYLSNQELKALYCEAAGLIFPSLYEGFGLPLVEAMTCSCPVICSDIPSSREVCGEAALFFDPKQPEDLANKLGMILNSPILIGELKERGELQSRNFSWMKTAQQTKQIFERYL